MRDGIRRSGFAVRKIRIGLLLGTVLGSGLPSAVLAAQPGSIAPPPVRRAVDGNGVDVIRATFNSEQPGVSIGTPDKGLSYQAENMGDGWVSDLRSGIVLSGSTAIVTINGASTSFTKSGTTYTATEGNGATLTQSGVNLTFTARDGTVAALLQNTSGSPYWDAGYARVTSITSTTGVRTDFSWKVTSYCPGGTEPTPATCPAGFKNALRLQSVTNTNGFQLKLSYASNALNDLNVGQTYDDWSKISTVRAINNASEYCDPTADSCTLTGAWPQLTFGNGTVTDSLNRVTTFSSTTNVSGQRVDKIKRPGAATDNVVVTYAAGVGVQSVVNEGVTYNYTFADSSTFVTPGNIRTTTVTSPAGSVVYTSDTIAFRVKTYRDELNRTTSYAYDSSGRITRVTQPEGNYTEYTYDVRGNQTLTRYVAKAGSGLADIVTSASYPTSCTNTKTCNKPASTTDAKGNVTDYTYDATHGGVLTMTSPAPATGGVRPQVRMTYGTAQAYYKNSAGSVVASGQTHYLLTATSACQTTASCAGALDEVKTTIGYGPQVAGTANNLYAVTASSGAGNGSLTATTSVTYDNVGNRTSVDGPLSGSADTTLYAYDAVRQITGVIGPDPDGTGPRRAIEQTFYYNPDGQLTQTLLGTADRQNANPWSTFVELQRQQTAYDAYARPFERINIGYVGGVSTLFGVTHYTYDALSRPSCVVQRMDPAQWSSQGVNCTPQTTGPNGPDRITKTTYDAASQVTKVQTAFGTADQSDEVTTTYNTNGTTATVADALGNLTTYEFDGFDRPIKTRYPTAGNGAVSSTTDYDGVTGYDANGNVTQRRLRDGQLINFTYDNLNRVTLKDVPAGAPYEYDISYQYDLMGRMTRATDANTHFTAFTYDALGRQTSEQSNWTTRSSEYDLGGRRTRLTWGDGFYVTYDYTVTGETTAIRENGATSGAGVLGTYSYNDFGQLVTLTRGNGVVSTFAYDPALRLQGMKHDLSGTLNDWQIGKVGAVGTAIAYNPASQIASLTRDNDAYAWNGHYNIDRPYTINGLNQMTVSGATALGYDGRGNLTSSGTTTYGYTSENRLATGAGYTMTYDPLGRFHWITNAGVSSWMQYDGGNIIEERGSAVQRRYVYGPGVDSPLVWYEGAGTTDRRWLIPDERGSIIAVTDASGAATAVNRYDEYGIPASTNVGRFQYTGQAWIPELGMNYYKARIYSPTLGRFLQTDPIGYEDGMNMYNYVGSDPVNSTDPTGLKRPEPPERRDNRQNGKEAFDASDIPCLRPERADCVTAGKNFGPPNLMGASDAQWLWNYIVHINPADQSGGLPSFPDGLRFHLGIIATNNAKITAYCSSVSSGRCFPGKTGDSSVYIGGSGSALCLAGAGYCGIAGRVWYEVFKAAACSGPNGPRSCTNEMSNEELRLNRTRFQGCASARDAVMANCFNWTADQGHWQQLLNTLRGRDKCDAILRRRGVQICSF